MNGDMMMQMADAEIDGNPTLDSDGDGVKDDTDNCRSISNPQQYNEDGDTLGDVCDPCPPYATYVIAGTTYDANNDPDGDGVGEGCDPVEGTTGARILLFDGFNAQMPGTTSGPAQPQFGNGTVRIVALGGAQTWGAVTFPVMFDLQKRQVVRTGLRVNQDDAADPVHGGGSINFYDGFSRGLACVYGTDAAGVVQYTLAEVNNNNPIPINMTSLATGTPQADVIQSRRGTSTYECSLFPGPQLVNGPYNGAMPTQTAAGVYVRGADVVFSWVLVVETM